VTLRGTLGGGAAFGYSVSSSRMPAVALG